MTTLIRSVLLLCLVWLGGCTYVGTTTPITDPTVNLGLNYDEIAGKTFRFVGKYTEVTEGEYQAGNKVIRELLRMQCEEEFDYQYESKDKYQKAVKIHFCDNESEFVDGRKDKQKYQFPFVGKTVVVERISGQWQHRLAYGTPSVEMRELFAHQKSRYSVLDLFPKRRVSVGDTWDFPPGVIPLFFGSSYFNPSGSAKGTLKEIRDYKGFGSAIVAFYGKVRGETPPHTGSSGTHEWLVEGEVYVRLVDGLWLYSKVNGDHQFNVHWLENGQTVRHVGSSQAVVVSKSQLSKD